MTVAAPQPVQRAPHSPARERVELILNHLDRLPALPGVVARLIAVTSSDETSVRDVVAIIETDAVLTAGILRLIRRADLGVRGQSMTVAKAVTLLGIRAVRNAALSSQFFETLSLKSSDPEEQKLRAGLWEHSLGVACAAEMIGQLHGGDQLAGEAFVCGLLHDIGKIALDACLPKSYAKTARHAERTHTCISRVEAELFGLDHTIAGKRLAGRWGLPQAVQECIWLHHQDPDDLPSSIGHANLVRIVRLADQLVRRQGIGFSGYAYVGAIDRLALSLGVRPDSIERMLGQLPERMAPLREVLGLQETPQASQSGPDVDIQRRLTEVNSRLSEENQNLAARSAYFDAMARFGSLITENDLISDVCAAAAETLAELFLAQSAVVFVQRAANTSVQAGVFEREQGRRPIILPHEHSAAPSHSDLVATIWREATHRAPLAELQPLSIASDEFQIKAVLEPGNQQLRVPSDGLPEWKVLARTIELAVCWSGARSHSEAMTQELLDLNRRCREAEQQLVHVRTITMVGEMAAGAAHELNNPLSVICGRAQMELDFAVEPERRRAMEIIVDQAKKASQIVLDLMRFAKPDPPQPRLQTVQQALHEGLQHWKRISGVPRVPIHIVECDPLLCIYADQHQFREILAAVMDNAVQACDPSSGRVQINSPSRPTDESVRIVVADNGPGMPPGVLDRAFDPFFSHRPAGRGRGMGLTLSYRLAEINGGRLWISSREGAGTTVTIELLGRPPVE